MRPFKFEEPVEYGTVLAVKGYICLCTDRLGNTHVTFSLFPQAHNIDEHGVCRAQPLCPSEWIEEAYEV